MKVIIWANGRHCRGQDCTSHGPALAVTHLTVAACREVGTKIGLLLAAHNDFSAIAVHVRQPRCMNPLTGYLRISCADQLLGEE